MIVRGIAALLLLALPVQAAEVTLKSDIAAATVYPDGATVTGRTEFSVEAGRHTLLLPETPLGLDPNSLRASGKGSAAFSIVSVELRAADASAVQARRASEAAKLQDAIERLQDQKAAAENQIAAADRQLAFIDATIKAASVSGKGDGAAPTAQDWMTLWQQSSASAAQALNARERARQLIRNLDRQIESLQARAPVDDGRPQQAIAVEIEAEAALDGEIEVSYFVGSASWAPVYDARLTTEGEQSLTLARRAAVQQSTGVPWTDVALTLSTARPGGRTSAIEPRRRFAQLRPDAPLGRVMGGLAQTYAPPPPAPAMEPAPQAVMVDEERAEADFVDASLVRAAARQLGDAVVYDVPARADISGKGVTRHVLIGEETFSAAIELRATPSVEKTAYLYAAFENADGLILPGEVTLNRDGLFVGKDVLPLIAAGAEGAVPFGSYESVKIGYRVVSQKDDDSFARADKLRAFRSEMHAENTSDKAWTVVLSDSKPETNTEEIEVTVVADPAPDETDADDVTGRLEWRFDLPPGAKQEIEYGFDVSYPLGRDLILR